MNEKQTIHDLLRSIEAPEFQNPDHQEALIRRLAPEICKAREQTEANPQRHFMPVRKLAIAGSALGIVILLIVLAVSLMPAKSAWAQALEALKNFKTLVITMRPLEPLQTEQDIGPDQKGVTYVAGDGRFAVVNDFEGSKSRGWFDGRKMITYIPDQNKVMTAEYIFDGDMPPYAQIFTSYRLLGRGYGKEHDAGLVEFEGKQYRKIELTENQKDGNQSMQVYYLDPETMRPRVMLVYANFSGALKAGMRCDFEFDGPLDDAIFTPEYPKDVEVVDQGTIHASWENGEEPAETPVPSPTPFAGPTVEVRLDLRGETVPGEPKVARLDNSFAALHKKAAGTIPYKMQRMGGRTPGEILCWLVQLPPGESYVIGWPAGEKKMFGYLSEPFVAREGSAVPFSPGMPATFEYDLTEVPEGIATFPARVFLLKVIQDETGERHLSWGGDVTLKEPGIARIEHIAGGYYVVSAQGGDDDATLHRKLPWLYDHRRVEIKPGVVNRFKPVWPRIDTTVEPGDATVRGRLVDATGQPVPGGTIYLRAIILNPQLYDLGPFYQPQVTDGEGRFSFVGVQPDWEYQIHFKSGGDDDRTYGIASNDLRTSGSVEVELKRE